MDDQVCRFCGCTNLNACMTEAGPCHWVMEDVCSACIDKLSPEEIQQLIGHAPASFETEYPLRNGASLIRTEENILFVRATPGGMPLTTDPFDAMNEVLDAYGDSLEEIKQFKKTDEYRHPSFIIIEFVKDPIAMKLTWEQLNEVGRHNLTHVLGYYSNELRRQWLDAIAKAGK